MSEIPGKTARGGLWPAAAAMAPLAGDLEELRRSVVRHLDSLESLALHAGPGEADDSRWPGDGAASPGELTAQLENDRLLLAAAWERLERERLELTGARPTTGPIVNPRMPRACETAPTPERTAARGAVATPAPNPVADNILRQFQTLCSDVRRTTDARSSSR